MTLLRRESYLEDYDVQGAVSSENSADIRPASRGGAEIEEHSVLVPSAEVPCDDEAPAQAVSLHPSLEFVR